MDEDDAMNGEMQWQSDKADSGHPYAYELESFMLPEDQKVAAPLSVSFKLCYSIIIIYFRRRNHLKKSHLQLSILKKV